MQETVTCDFGQKCLPPRLIYFKRCAGNSSKYYTNQKKSSGDSAVICHKDECPLKQTTSTSYSAQVTAAHRQKFTPPIIMTPVWKCVRFVLEPLFLSETQLQAVTCVIRQISCCSPSFDVQCFVVSPWEPPFQISLSKMSVWANKMKSGWRHSEHKHPLCWD